MMLVSVLCFMGFSSFLYIGCESAFHESEVGITAFDGEGDTALVDEELADEARDDVGDVVDSAGASIGIGEVVALGGHGGQLLFFDGISIAQIFLAVKHFF